MLTRREFTVAAGAMLLAGPAHAQGAYPNKPIRILVGFPPGGGVDFTARLLGEQIKNTLGQPVIVENRPGASAMIAAQAVATAPPDGYILLAASAGEIATNQYLYKERMTYDPLRQLAPIALVGIVPNVVVVGAGTPVHNPAELIAYARQNRGKLSFSSSGLGNPQQLAGELMNSMAGTDVLHVPYRGAAPAATAVAEGTVTMSFTSLAASLPFIQSGKVRAVAVTSLQRMPQLPDVQTMSEGLPGLKGYELLNWFALFAPAGTPDPIIARLNQIANTAVHDPDIAHKLEIQGILPRPMTPAEFKTFVAAEAEKFGQIIARANIHLEN